MQEEIKGSVVKAQLFLPIQEMDRLTHISWEELCSLINVLDPRCNKKKVWKQWCKETGGSLRLLWEKQEDNYPNNCINDISSAGATYWSFNKNDIDHVSTFAGVRNIIEQILLLIQSIGEDEVKELLRSD